MYLLALELHVDGVARRLGAVAQVPPGCVVGGPSSLPSFLTAAAGAGGAVCGALFGASRVGVGALGVGLDAVPL